MKFLSKSGLQKVKSLLIASLVIMGIAPAALAQPITIDSSSFLPLERTSSERFFGEGRDKLEREILMLRRGDLSATDGLLKIDEDLLNQSGILSLEEHPQFQIDIRMLPQETTE